MDMMHLIAFVVPLEAPSNLTAALGNSVILIWDDNSAGETGFIIHRAEGIGFTKIPQSDHVQRSSRDDRNPNVPRYSRGYLLQSTSDQRARFFWMCYRTRKHTISQRNALFGEGKPLSKFFLLIDPRHMPKILSTGLYVLTLSWGCAAQRPLERPSK